jgi:hypothetical protein
MRRGPIACLLAAALVLAVTACSPKHARGFDPDFYVAPTPMPKGEPGDVLRVQQVSGLDGGGRLLRVLYRSTSLAGKPIAVSGVIAVPGGTPPPGGWPVISLAHGTVGLADDCTPSHAPGRDAANFTKRGFLVAATDYEGLGTAGRHPYLVGESEARSTIDIVRAARNLGPTANAGTRYVVIGYSQGGHAALFTNQIAASWAPELTLVGTVAGAPVVELDQLVGAIGDPSYDWLKVSMAAGFAAVDPSANPSAVLGPSAAHDLEVVDSQCVTEAARAIDGKAPIADLRTVAPFAQLLATNTPGQVRGTSPVYLLGGTKDPLITPSLLDAGMARLCAIGDVVQRRSYDADHDTIITASLLDAVTWAKQRLDGAAPANDCP